MHLEQRRQHHGYHAGRPTVVSWKCPEPYSKNAERRDRAHKMTSFIPFELEYPEPSGEIAMTETISDVGEHSYREEKHGILSHAGLRDTDLKRVHDSVADSELLDLGNAFGVIRASHVPENEVKRSGSVFFSTIAACTGDADLTTRVTEEIKPLPEPTEPPVPGKDANMEEKQAYVSWMVGQQTAHEPTGDGLRWDLKKLHERTGKIVNCGLRKCLVLAPGVTVVPDYENGKRRTYDLNKLKWSRELVDKLSTRMGISDCPLVVEPNCYHGKKARKECCIPPHRDAERKLVIGARLGDAPFFLMFIPFYDAKPVGVPIIRLLAPGTVYAFSIEAAGWSLTKDDKWSAKNHKGFHWKHAAGHNILPSFGKHKNAILSLISRWCEERDMPLPKWMLEEKVSGKKRKMAE